MDKNLSLLETYHISNVFDNALDTVYKYILKFCNIFELNFISAAEQYNNKVKFIGYDYDIENNVVINQLDKSLCKNPIYMKIVINDGYKFAIKKSSVICIECNMAVLLTLYIKLNISEFKTAVKSGLKHEFLHIYQLLKDNLFNVKTFEKINLIKKYLDSATDLNIDLSEDLKSDILSLLQLLLKTELDACLNGVTEKLSSYSRLFIYDNVYDIYGLKAFKITDVVIKYCSELVKEESKLFYILTLLQYVKENKLINIIENINKVIHIYDGYIETYIKKYEIKILKLIYYVLHNIIKYDKELNVLSEIFLYIPSYIDTYFYSLTD